MPLPDIEVGDGKKALKPPVQKAPEVEAPTPIAPAAEVPEVPKFDKQQVEQRIRHIVEAGASVGKSMFGQEMPASDKKILVDDWTTVAQDYDIRIPKWLHLIVTILVTVAIIRKTYKAAMEKVEAYVKGVVGFGKRVPPRDGEISGSK